MSSKATVGEWETLLNEVVDNQAEGLPDFANVTDLHNFEIKLEDTRRFSVWSEKVTFMLQARGLQHIINDKIPRPGKDEPAAQKWRQISMEVKQWLVDNMSDEVYQNISCFSSLDSRVVFADEFMREAKRVIQGEGPYVHLRHVAAFDVPRREDFNTAKEFVIAYMERFNKLLGLGLKMEPYYAILRVINQLHEAGDSEIVINNVMSDLVIMNTCESVLEEFKVQNFNNLCISIIRGFEHLDRHRNTRRLKLPVSHVPRVQALEKKMMFAHLRQSLDYCPNVEHRWLDSVFSPFRSLHRRTALSNRSIVQRRKDKDDQQGESGYLARICVQKTGGSVMDHSIASVILIASEFCEIFRPGSLLSVDFSDNSKT